MFTQREKNAHLRVNLHFPFPRKVQISYIFPIILIIDTFQKLSILIALYLLLDCPSNPEAPRSL